MSDLYTYFGKFFENWFLYMTAGPFVTDEILLRVWPKARATLSRWISKRTRRRVEVALLLIGVFWAGFAAFKEEHSALQATLNKPQSPFQLDVREHGVDEEARQKNGDLEKKLTAANATIERLQAANDPLNQTIASAQFIVTAQLANNKMNNVTEMAGAAVALFQERILTLKQENGPSPLLICTVNQFDISNENELSIRANANLDSKIIGKSVRSLADASILTVEIPVNEETEITGGLATLIVNGSVTLKFKIPAVPCQRSAGSCVFAIHDIKEGLAPLTTQPSPTPDKEEPKH